MVKRTATLILIAIAVLTAEIAAQALPRLQVGVRPARVRVGDTFVLTVRLDGPGWPEVLDVEMLTGGEVVDVRDRSSAALGRAGANVVVEREFVIRAVRPGSAGPASVFASWGADTVRAAVPRVEAVGAAVAWAPPATGPRGAREDPPLRDQGVPPSSKGRDADRERAPQGLYPPVYPGVPGDRVGWPGGSVTVPPGTVMPGPGGGYPVAGGYPGVPGYPGSPYAPSGWGVAPPGQGWAPTAAGDPWWPELVPRLDRYQTLTDDGMGLVRLEAGVTPLRVYQGQQATLVATATFAPEALARMGTTPEFFPPTAGDAWAVEIPYAPPTPAAVGGRVQEAHTFMRAFFPVSAGTLEVGPTRLRYGMGGGGSAARPQEELATEPLTVEVVPIPDRGAPPGWSGAVGRFRVAAWVQPTSVGFGEAAFLTVEVAGVGNVRDLARPDLGQIWGAEFRPTGERAYPEVRDGVVGGVKTFSWLVVPTEPGMIRIGPVIFPFFDPWMEAFGQVASEELLLESRPFPAGPGGPAGDDGGATRSLPNDPEAETPGDHPEAEAAALLERIGARPDDGDAWVELAAIYQAGRGGEGWAEWALLSGVRASPRHGPLRDGVPARWTTASAPVPGLPRLPMTARESMLLASGLGLTGVGLGAAWVRRGVPVPVGRATWGLALLAAVGVGALEPWFSTRDPGAVGVVVEGPVELRTHPAQAATEGTTARSGEPVRVLEQYGGWVRVEAGEVEGWTEAVRVVAPYPGAHPAY